LVWLGGSKGGWLLVLRFYQMPVRREGNGFKAYAPQRPDILAESPYEPQVPTVSEFSRKNSTASPRSATPSEI
jgi:hypothetical protein